MKTLKLLDQPTLEDMVAQMGVLQTWLPGIVRTAAGGR